MTDSESQREAAERLRTSSPGSGYFFSYGSIGTQYLQDLKTMTDYALSLLDETPVDEAWLRSLPDVLFTIDGNDWLLTIRHAPSRYTELYRTPHGVWKLGSGDHRHMTFITLHEPPNTRGQLRHLLAALRPGTGTKSTTNA